MIRISDTCLLLCCCLVILPTSADDKSGALTLVQHEENNDDVTIEVNGEDSTKVSESIEKPTDQFQPTDQWQKVKDGQAIPAGLHVRLNMETGEREAKLMEGDSGLKYWKSGDREGMMNMNKKQFSMDELKQALKDFKTTKLDETDLEGGKRHLKTMWQQEVMQREDQVKAKFRSYKDLKKDFEAMNVGIKTDGQIVEEMLDKLKNKDVQTSEVVLILQDLEYYLHQFDNAVLFKDFGGLQVLVKLLNTTADEEIKIEAAMCLGAASSSNPQVQIGAAEAGALHVLLKMMSTEPSVNIRRKVLYAISTVCRNFPYVQRRFLQLGGLSVLGQIFKESDAEKLKIKSISFLNDLLVEKDEAVELTNKDKSSEVEKLRQYSQVNLREAMLEQGWCDLVPQLLELSEHDSREQVLKTMKTLGDTCTETFSHSRKTLGHLKKEYKMLAFAEGEEKEDDYFTHMLTLIEDLMRSLNIREEL